MVVVLTDGEKIQGWIVKPPGFDAKKKYPQGYKTINITEASHPYSGAWWPPGHILGYEHTFVHAVHDFLTAIEKDTVASPNFKDGVYELAVMETVEKSAKSGKWQAVTQ